MAVNYNPPAPSIPAFAQRDDIVLVEAEADFPAVVGSVHPLDSTKLYQLKGQTVLTSPVEPNGSYLEGRLGRNDILASAIASIFSGGGSASIRNMTVDGAFVAGVFNLTAKSASDELLVENIRFVSGGSMGSIAGYGKVEFVNCKFSGSGPLTMNGCESVKFSNCEWSSIINPLAFANSFKSIILEGCSFAGSCTGTYIGFSGSGTISAAQLDGIMLNVAAGSLGFNGGSGGSLTIGACKYNLAIENTGGTSTSNVVGWTAI